MVYAHAKLIDIETRQVVPTGVRKIPFYCRSKRLEPTGTPTHIHAHTPTHIHPNIRSHVHVLFKMQHMVYLAFSALTSTRLAMLIVVIVTNTTVHDNQKGRTGVIIWFI